MPIITDRIQRNLTRIPVLVYSAIALALFVQLISWFFLLPHTDLSVYTSGDGIGYYQLAESLTRGEGFGRYVESEGFVFETFRTPGVPFLLSIFLHLGYAVTTYLFFVSLLSAVCIPLCTWYIGRALFSDNVGRLSALLIALEPLIIIHGWLLLTEIPFLISMLIGVCFLIRSFRSSYMLQLNALYAGLAFSLSIYIRPSVLPLLFVGIISAVVYFFIVEKKILSQFIFSFMIVVLLLTPWYVRTHELTGVYALSGTGWRNVYTDYLASIRALNNGTRFIDEKEALKRYAMKEFGITRTEINSPAESERLKAYALPEILSNKRTVVKLQSILLISYLTHSDYQRRLQKFGLLPANKIEASRKSSSILLVSKGFGALPEIYLEMKNRHFIPVLERAWTLGLLLFVALGFFVSTSRARFFIFGLLVLGYLTSSAIGLGVEGRLRIPVIPFYFMLASCGMLFLYSSIKSRIPHALWKK